MRGEDESDVRGVDNHADDITSRIRFAAGHNAEDALPDREDSIEDDVGRISAPTDVVDAVDPEQGSTDSRSGGRADGSGSENVGVRTRAGVPKVPRRNSRAPGSGNKGPRRNRRGRKR